MAQAVFQSPEVVIAAQTTKTSITSKYTLSGDANYPTKWAGTTANGVNVGGTAKLYMFFEWDGTHGARYSVTSTSPTTAVGHLVPTNGVLGAALSSTLLVITGSTEIAAFKVIGTGSGINVTWYITVADDRR